MFNLPLLFSRTATSTPVDLLDAIGVYFLTAGLNSVITGGLFLARASRRSAYPFATIEDTSAPISLDTSSSKLYTSKLRFKIYADMIDNAGPLGDQLATAFKGQRLQFQNGVTGRFIAGDRGHRLDTQRSTRGNDVWYLYCDFTVQVKRF